MGSEGERSEPSEPHTGSERSEPSKADGAERAAGDADPDGDEPSALAAAGLDAAAAEPDVPGDGEGFPDDEGRVDLLRGVAEEIRGESSERKQLAAILYRVSDLYDPDEETTPEEIYLNVRTIMQVKARGGLRPEE